MFNYFIVQTPNSHGVAYTFPLAYSSSYAIGIAKIANTPYQIVGAYNKTLTTISLYSEKDGTWFANTISAITMGY